MCDTLHAFFVHENINSTAAPRLVGGNGHPRRVETPG
jgi:hypothetical protein